MTQPPTRQLDLLRRPVGRRAFLASLSALTVGAALTGCVPPGPTPAVGEHGAATPAPNTAARRVEPSPSSTSLTLDEFLAISAQLTGFPASALDPHLATLYLASLRTAGDPTALRAVGATTAPSPLADAVIRCWYSGIYDTPNGPAVATYTDALAWRAVGYTTAPTSCHGATGYWAEPPATAA